MIVVEDLKGVAAEVDSVEDDLAKEDIKIMVAMSLRADEVEVVVVVDMEVVCIFYLLFITLA